MGVYYSEENSRSSNLITRTSVSPSGSWSYAEPHRPDGKDAIRLFGFETISGSRYADVLVRWRHATPSDKVETQSISDAKPNDHFLVEVDAEKSADLLQALRFRKE